MDFFVAWLLRLFCCFFCTFMAVAIFCFSYKLVRHIICLVGRSGLSAHFETLYFYCRLLLLRINTDSACHADVQDIRVLCYSSYILLRWFIDFVFSGICKKKEICNTKENSHLFCINRHKNFHDLRILLIQF